MPANFRVIDTGVRSGRQNIAFDGAMLEAIGTNDIPDSIRFLRFCPTVLVGRHQALRHEVELEYCLKNDIGVARRLTGGGAIYFDEGQIGWELVFRRASLGIASLTELTREICEAAALGLSSLGIDARYRPRNDIEVDGRKVSGTGGFFDGDCLFYQGTVLVQMDPEIMVSALRVPAAKLGKRGIASAAARVVTLGELLGDGVPDFDAIKAALVHGFEQRLGIQTYNDEPAAAEERIARRVFGEEVGTDAFVEEIDAPAESADTSVGYHQTDGGALTCYVRLEGGKQDRFREIVFTGDIFVTPPRLVFDLEAALRGTHVSQYRAVVSEFFARANYDMLSVTPSDFATAIEDALSPHHNAP